MRLVPASLITVSAGRGAMGERFAEVPRRPTHMGTRISARPCRDGASQRGTRGCRARMSARRRAFSRVGRNEGIYSPVRHLAEPNGNRRHEKNTTHPHGSYVLNGRGRARSQPGRREYNKLSTTTTRFLGLTKSTFRTGTNTTPSSNRLQTLPQAKAFVSSVELPSVSTELRGHAQAEYQAFVTNWGIRREAGEITPAARGMDARGGYERGPSCDT